MLRIAAKVC